MMYVLTRWTFWIDGCSDSDGCFDPMDVLTLVSRDLKDVLTRWMFSPDRCFDQKHYIQCMWLASSLNDGPVALVVRRNRLQARSEHAHVRSMMFADNCHHFFGRNFVSVATDLEAVLRPTLAATELPEMPDCSPTKRFSDHGGGRAGFWIHSCSRCGFDRPDDIYRIKLTKKGYLLPLLFLLNDVGGFGILETRLWSRAWGGAAVCKQWLVDAVRRAVTR